MGHAHDRNIVAREPPVLPPPDQPRRLVSYAGGKGDDAPPTGRRRERQSGSRRMAELYSLQRGAAILPGGTDIWRRNCLRAKPSACRARVAIVHDDGSVTVRLYGYSVPITTAGRMPKPVDPSPQRRWPVVGKLPSSRNEGLMKYAVQCALRNETFEDREAAAALGLDDEARLTRSDK